MKKLSIQDICLVSLFTALIAVGAFIRVPVPPVPFTLQLLFVTLAGVLLGAKKGALSALLYMILGLVGLPIFTGGGGFGYIFTPTFGYILGFPIGAFLIGYLCHKKSELSILRLTLSCLAGLGIVYAVGMGYYCLISKFYLGKDVEIMAVIYSHFLIFVPKDLILCGLSAIIGKRLIPILRKN